MTNVKKVLESEDIVPFRYNVEIVIGKPREFVYHRKKKGPFKQVLQPWVICQKFVSFSNKRVTFNEIKV